MAYEIKLPNAQGWTENVDRAIDDYLERYFPELKHEPAWSIALPVLQRCDWEAPTGEMPGSISNIVGVDEAKAKAADKSHLVTKFVTESKTRDCFYGFFEQIGTRSLLASDIGLDPAKLDFIGNFLKIKIEKEENQTRELTDILIISESAGILIIEVKPSLTEVTKAKKQLKWAKEWLLNKVLNQTLPEHSIPVRKIIALPDSEKSRQRTNDAAPHKHSDDTIFCFQEDLSSLDAIKSWAEQERIIKKELLFSEEEFQKLFRTVFLLKITQFQKGKAQARKAHVEERTLDGHLVERELVDTLTSQAYLSEPFQKQQKFTNPRGKKLSDAEKVPQASAEPEMSAEEMDRIKRLQGKFPENPSYFISQRGGRSGDLSRSIFNEVLFLNPEQMRIWDSPYPLQEIWGYASTGKTVLIQSKALDLLRAGEKVMIIVPDCILSYYTEFMRQNGFHQEEESGLVIGNLMVLLKTSLDDFHLFFDETSFLQNGASKMEIGKCLEVIKQVIAKEQSIVWVAFDGCQFMPHKIAEENVISEGSQLDLVVCIVKLIRQSQFGNHRMLTTSLRCTIEVYTEWKRYVPGGHLLRVGHNVKGHEPKVIPVNLVELANKDAGEKLNVIAGMIIRAVTDAINEGWRPYEILVALNTSNFNDGAKKLKQKLAAFTPPVHFTLVSAEERFKGVELETETWLTVDTPNNIVTQEWPVVIEVDDPRCTYVRSSSKYIIKSRCLVQLITIQIVDREPNDPVYLDAVLRRGSLEDIINLLNDLSLCAFASITEIAFCIFKMRDMNEIRKIRKVATKTIGEIASEVAKMLNRYDGLCKKAHTEVTSRFNSEAYLPRYIVNTYFMLLRTWHQSTELLENYRFLFDDEIKLDLQLRPGLVQAAKEDNLDLFGMEFFLSMMF